jgi:hypothetical protein
VTWFRLKTAEGDVIQPNLGCASCECGVESCAVCGVSVESARRGNSRRVARMDLAGYLLGEF